MDADGEALLKRIQKCRNVYDYVLVRATSDGLRLIGPSTESYQLKEKLLGRVANRSERNGRNHDRSSRQRSSSAPAVARKATEGKRATADDPPPRGASGYTPANNHQDIKQEAARPKAAPLGVFQRMRRSVSESRPKKEARRANRVSPETENTHPLPKSTSKSSNLPFSFKDLWRGLKKNKAKKWAENFYLWL